MRFFNFSENAPNDFKSNLQTNTSKNTVYTLAAKFIPWGSLAITTILAAIQVSLDNTDTANKTYIDNGMTPAIAGVNALSILFASVFSYLQSTTEAQITALTTEGVKRNYFAIDTATSTRPAATPRLRPMFVSIPASKSAEEGEASQRTDDELSVMQKIEVDALVRRFTR
jgi:hypothetical protein